MKQFINTENSQNKAGIYGLNMYALGVPTSIVIDDNLVAGGGYNYFSDPGKDKSLWGPFFEKAFAKFHGNYVHTVAGWPIFAVKNLINSPAIAEFSHTQVTAD